MISERDYYRLKTDSYNTICFGFPRSGTTLLMRLVHLACYTHVTGDYPLEFYQNLMTLRSAAKLNAQYGDLREAEIRKQFMDTYHGKEEEQTNNLLDYHLKNCFIKSGGPCFAKATILGFGNQDLGPFIAILRDMYNSHWQSNELRIVFLTRDKMDCANSLANRHRLDPSYERDLFVENAIKLYEEQHEQFKEAAELGDIWIKYDDIVNNTMETLIKMQPQFYPNEMLVNRVLLNKIK